jgi:putative spermidine/putrescine transport system substrate-binding protein
MLVTVFAGCGKKTPTPATTTPGTATTAPTAAPTKPAEVPKVTIWTSGSANVRTLFEALIAAFNKDPKYKDTAKLELQFILSGTGEQGLRDRIVAAQKAGQTKTDFDVIAINADEITSYTALGGDDVFVKLDKTKIPNSKNVLIQSSLKPECSLPYRGTTVLLAYDSARVTNPPKTDKELYQWIKDHPGKFAYNPPSTGGAGSAFVRNALYNSLPAEALMSGDKKWIDQWGPGWDLLKELHPYMYKSGNKVTYPNKNQGTLDLLTNKEVDMIPAWADMTLTALDQGTLPSTVKITQISPAFTGTPVVLCIPKIAEKPEDAYSFMDFMVTPDAQDICLNTIYAIPVIDSKQLKSTKAALVKDLKLEEFRFSSTGDLGTEMNKQWDEKIATLK